MDAIKSGPERAAARREPGRLEAGVLTARSQAPEPVPASWVRDEVDPALAYTTVATALSRLETKHAVARSRLGRGYGWRALLDDAGLAAIRMHRVLDGESDRQGVLSRFVADLPPGDEQTLRDRLSAAPSLLLKGYGR
ncbi:BlaI/MecI/CopY family transcriptional regulator [Streptomyces globosus]|uniref:BlaI/MecI/CopY family transcriptional regulator n=1 Tax=Streptomyces globosus TaxID=68209 RepID=UPI001FE8438E|nr:BlaI/MecI/CopY family transcriptional regulator [Streptomyces globosus]